MDVLLKVNYNVLKVGRGNVKGIFMSKVPSASDLVSELELNR